MPHRRPQFPGLSDHFLPSHLLNVASCTLRSNSFQKSIVRPQSNFRCRSNTFGSTVYFRYPIIDDTAISSTHCLPCTRSQMRALSDGADVLAPHRSVVRRWRAPPSAVQPLRVVQSMLVVGLEGHRFFDGFRLDSHVSNYIHARNVVRMGWCLRRAPPLLESAPHSIVVRSASTRIENDATGKLEDAMDLCVQMSMRKSSLQVRRWQVIPHFCDRCEDDSFPKM
jgi:hypothetical protein